MKILIVPFSCTALEKSHQILRSSIVRSDRMHRPVCYEGFPWKVNIYLIRGLLDPELSSSSKEEREGTVINERSGKTRQRVWGCFSARCNALWHVCLCACVSVWDLGLFGVKSKTDEGAQTGHVLQDCHNDNFPWQKHKTLKYTQALHKFYLFHCHDKCITTFQLVGIKAKEFHPKEISSNLTKVASSFRTWLYHNGANYGASYRNKPERSPQLTLFTIKLDALDKYIFMLQCTNWGVRLLSHYYYYYLFIYLFILLLPAHRQIHEDTIWGKNLFVPRLHVQLFLS